LFLSSWGEITDTSCSFVVIAARVARLSLEESGLRGGAQG